MIAIRNTFKQRKKELNLFLKNLKIVEENKKFQADFCNILYSNALLMLYNIVESTVMGGILEIYGAVNSQGFSYKTVSTEIQNIWFDFRFNEIYGKTANYKSYKDRAFKMVDDILSDKVIKLTRKAVHISGNLNAEKIRNICNEHGIKFTTHNKSQGGCKIEDIRNLRNNLAHGEKSFVECGRDFTFSDLETMTNEVLLFLDGLLNGMTKYYNNKAWSCQK
ncbi:MAG: hypothetical protein LBH25_06885 [Fibromonadaceae bacterium]|jgi:hypothetical protein|nr:hypothetical protein [Fibromonadaceae bacterium]